MSLTIGSNDSAAAARIAQSLVTNSASASAATGTTAGSATTDSGTSISSSDFLTLLVTEMKNQDPTQPTDPNAYIQQLVGVNSLQQLISINTELGAATGSSASSGDAAAAAVSGM